MKDLVVWTVGILLVGSIFLLPDSKPIQSVNNLQEDLIKIYG